jgi:hypothetical protein
VFEVFEDEESGVRSFAGAAVAMPTQG